MSISREQQRRRKKRNNKECHMKQTINNIEKESTISKREIVQTRVRFKIVYGIHISSRRRIFLYAYKA